MTLALGISVDVVVPDQWYHVMKREQGAEKKASGRLSLHLEGKTAGSRDTEHSPFPPSPVGTSRLPHSGQHSPIFPSYCPAKVRRNAVTVSGECVA